MDKNLSPKILGYHKNSGNFVIPTDFKDFTSLFDERLPEDDLKTIETFRSISGLYVKVYISNVCSFVRIIY